MTTEKFINKLMEFNCGEYFYSPVSKIIAIQPSKSTNSSYVLFKTEDGNIHELGVSDHQNIDRTEDFDLFCLESDVSDEDYRNFLRELNLFYQWNYEFSYEINEVSRKILYTNNLENDYIFARSFDRAIVSDNYVARKVEIVEDGLLMKVTYEDDDVQYYTTSYNPFAVKADDSDYHDVDVLRKFYNGSEIRKFLKNPKYMSFFERDLVEMMREAFDPHESEEDVAEREEILKRTATSRDFSEIVDYLFGQDDDITWSDLNQEGDNVVFIAKYDNQGGF